MEHAGGRTGFYSAGVEEEMAQNSFLVGSVVLGGCSLQQQCCLLCYVPVGERLAGRQLLHDTLLLFAGSWDNIRFTLSLSFE